MNYKMVGFVLGRIFLIEAALMLFPMGCAAIYGEWSVVLSFLWPALIVLALGLRMGLGLFFTPSEPFVLMAGNG